MCLEKRVVRVGGRDNEEAVHGGSERHGGEMKMLNLSNIDRRPLINSGEEKKKKEKKRKSYVDFILFFSTFSLSN